MAVSLGTVAFVHVVKVSVPLFLTVYGYVRYGHRYALSQVLAVCVVCGGVALTATHLGMQSRALACALLTNVAFPVRNVEHKRVLLHRAATDHHNHHHHHHSGAAATPSLSLREHMRQFAALSRRSAVLSLALALIVLAPTGYALLFALDQPLAPLLGSVTLHALNTMLSMIVLGMVSPLTHSALNVGNRAVSIACALTVQSAPVEPLTLFGLAVSFAGLYAYSVLAHPSASAAHSSSSTHA